MREKILSAVTAAIDEINETLTNKVDLSLGEDAPLYGRQGVMDSLALVSLIVNIESRIEEIFHKPLILANEKSMSLKNSPFANLGAIVNYITDTLENNEVIHV